jgi:hypothetical protein
MPIPTRALTTSTGRSARPADLHVDVAHGQRDRDREAVHADPRRSTPIHADQEAGRADHTAIDPWPNAPARS